MDLKLLKIIIPIFFLSTFLLGTVVGSAPKGGLEIPHCQNERFWIQML